MGLPFMFGQPWDTLILAGAVITALVAVIKLPGILWQHVLIPVAKFVVEASTVSDLTRIAPDLISLSHAAPALIQLSRMATVLDDIAQQFKTDSGSSLRDIVNRLEAAAKKTQLAVDEMQRTQSAPEVLQTAKVEASEVRRLAAAAGAELIAVATRAASQLMAVATAADEKKKET